MKNLITSILAIILVASFTFLGLSSITQKNDSLGSSLPQAVAVFETSLQSPITSSATTMTLTANSIRGGGSLSGYNCFTVDEGNSNAETICGTVSGTTVSSLVRGISQATGTTTVSALQFSHRRGANVKITDFPIIQILKAQNNGEDTYPNSLTFDAINSYSSALSFTPGSNQLVTALYADSVANQGAATSSESIAGIVEQATQIEMASSTVFDANNPHVINSEYATSTPDGTSQAGLYVPVSKNNGKLHQLWLDLTEAFTWAGNHIFNGTTTFNDSVSITATTTFSGAQYGSGTYYDFTASTTIAVNDAVYLATTTTALQLSDGNDQNAVDFLGFAKTAGTNGGTVSVQTDGIVSGFAGLTVGSDYWVQDTAGSIGTSRGTYEIYVGKAISATEILLQQPKDWQYIGNEADGGDDYISIPYYASRAVLSINCNGGGSHHGEMYLDPKKTTGTISDKDTSTYTITATWFTASSSIDMNASGACSAVAGTAYFYK